MAKNIKQLAEALGAELVGAIPDVGGGAFGASRLARLLKVRLEPSRGQRPGRPTDATWVRHPKVPMSEETAAKLTQLAQRASTPERKVSAMQVAAQILEEAVANYRADV